MTLLDLKLWKITCCLDCSYLLPGISKYLSFPFSPEGISLTDIARSREAKNAKESESEKTKSWKPSWHTSALLSLNWKWVSLFLFCCIPLCLVIASHRGGNGPSTWVNQLSKIPTQGVFKPFCASLNFRHVQVEECLGETGSVLMWRPWQNLKHYLHQQRKKKKKTTLY